MAKILWLSPFSLHDTASGAAVNCHYLLRSLHKHGFEVRACSSFIFDAPCGAMQHFGSLEEMFLQDNREVFNFVEEGIHYTYTRVASTHEQEMTLGECQLFYSTFCQELKDFEPDIVIGYGRNLVVMTCFAYAKQKNIGTVYVLSNGTYSSYLFPNIDLILTDSYATAKLYAERDEINAVPIGAFFDLDSIVSQEHQKRFVTFINPSDYKGVAIFAKLAKVCQERLPKVQFLTVNTHERFSDLVEKLHLKDDLNAFPYKQNDFPNVFMVEQQKDMRAIYAISAVVLVPSLWFEAWGRVASEAVFNNIPVIASNSGGLAEASAGGGVLIDTPDHCQNDYYSLPSDEEIEPWVNALQVLLTENFDQELLAARERLSQDSAVKRLIKVLTPLINKHQGKSLNVDAIYQELADQDAPLDEINF